MVPMDVSPGAQWTPVCSLICGLLVVLPDSLMPASPHPSYPALPHPQQASERRLRPLPQKQRTLHEKILEEIKQERRLRPVATERWGGRGELGMPPSFPPFTPHPAPSLTSSPALPLPPPGFGSLPCILNACSGDVKSTSCINLSLTDAGSCARRPRPRVLLKAPTLAEMEEMNTSEVRSHRPPGRRQGGSSRRGEEVRRG